MSYLRDLVDTAKETIESGYYRRNEELVSAPSLARAIEQDRTIHDPALIAEIKPASPTKGKIVDGGWPQLVERFLADGACALSVLTEPRRFGGSLANLRLAVATGRPTVMKDFILSEAQIDCAASFGASAVLLIASILPKNRLPALIEYAHVAEREVLLECGSREEVEAALGTDADLIGINNRDLRTFQVDLERTASFAKGLDFDRPLVSLSGFQSRADVVRVKGTADAVLVGSSLVEGKTTVAELIGA